MSIGSLRLLAVSVAGLAVLAGCQQDMAQAPYYKPLEESDFFKDKKGQSRSSALMPVSGTVARGELRDDDELFLGKVNGQLTERMPVEVTKELLERGMDRYNIYCSPCHGFTGDGNGMIVQRGLSRPPSFHIDRLTTAPVGHFYDVISNGYGRMYGYKHIHVRDRWAITAYVRALQYSQNAKIEDVPEELRATMPEKHPVVPAATGAAAGSAAAPAPAATVMVAANSSPVSTTPKGGETH